MTLLHSKNEILSCFVESKPAELETSTVILPTTESVLWWVIARGSQVVIILFNNVQEK